MLQRIFLLSLAVVFSVGCGPNAGSSGSSSGSRSGSNSNERSRSDEEPFNPLAARTRVSDTGALNVGVAVGGGNNSFASVVLADEFEKAVGQPMPAVLDLFWGLSGGTIPATFFMKGIKEVPKKFRQDVTAAFPDIEDLKKKAVANVRKPAVIQAMAKDEDGARRKAFIDALVKHLGNQNFAQSNSRAVIVASAKEQPVCFAHSKIILPASCKTMTEKVRVVDAMADSSNYQLAREMFIGDLNPFFRAAAEKVLPEFSALFQIRTAPVEGMQGQVDIIDGFLAGKHIDGNSPLPLVVDHLLSIKTKNNGEHNIVVFDNGSAAISDYRNDDYRTRIGLDNEGYARVEKDGVVVNVYLIKIDQSRVDFDAGIIDTSTARMDQLEELVRDEIQGPRKGIFDAALQAVKKNL